MALSLLQILGLYLKADVFSDIFSLSPRPCGNHCEEITMYRETEKNPSCWRNQTSFPPPLLQVKCQKTTAAPGQVRRTMTHPRGALCSVWAVPWLLCMTNPHLLGTSLLVTTTPLSLCGELLLTNGAFINRTMFN